MEAKNIMDIRDELRKPFPPEAISQHPTKSFLSTIKAIYITERLNDLFGIGGWTLEHEIVSDAPEYVAVRGRIIIGEPYNIRTPDQYGGHNKTGKNTEPADGYKSAMTDCQSKCASYLEIGIDVFKGTQGKTQQQKPPEAPQDAPEPTKEDVQDFVTLSQLEAVDGLLDKLNLNRAGLGEWLVSKKKLSKPNLTMMSMDDATKMIAGWDTFSADLTMYCMNNKSKGE